MKTYKYQIKIRTGVPDSIPHIWYDKSLQLGAARAVAAFCGVNENDVLDVTVEYSEKIKPGMFEGELIELPSGQ